MFLRQRRRESTPYYMQVSVRDCSAPEPYPQLHMLGSRSQRLNEEAGITVMNAF